MKSFGFALIFDICLYRGGQANASHRQESRLEARPRRDMEEMALRLTHALTLRLGSMLVVAIGVVAALVKLL